jgi:hypothetical protein
MAPNDIAVQSAHSVAEVQDMLRKKAAQLGPGQWITGYGWQESNLAEKRNLTRADLDAATPDNPVMLVRAGAHSAVSNSAALKIAKIDRTTPDPKSGLIEHDAAGEPNGIIRERFDLVSAFIPTPSWESMRPAYIGWLKNILSLGITSFHDASGTIDDEPVGKGGAAGTDPGASWAGANMTFRRAREIYAEMGDQLPRITMYIIYPGAERLKAFPITPAMATSTSGSARSGERGGRRLHRPDRLAARRLQGPARLPWQGALYRRGIAGDGGYFCPPRLADGPALHRRCRHRPDHPGL